MAATIWDRVAEMPTTTAIAFLDRISTRKLAQGLQGHPGLAAKYGRLYAERLRTSTQSVAFGIAPSISPQWGTVDSALAREMAITETLASDGSAFITMSALLDWWRTSDVVVIDERLWRLFFREFIARDLRQGNSVTFAVFADVLGDRFTPVPAEPAGGGIALARQLAIWSSLESLS